MSSPFSPFTSDIEEVAAATPLNPVDFGATASVALSMNQGPYHFF
jgi:hypothetical protein